jgi:hypothetical protein
MARHMMTVNWNCKSRCNTKGRGLWWSLMMVEDMHTGSLGWLGGYPDFDLETSLTYLGLYTSSSGLLIIKDRVHTHTAACRSTNPFLL